MGLTETYGPIFLDVVGFMDDCGKKLILFSVLHVLGFCSGSFVFGPLFLVPLVWPILFSLF